MSPQYPQTAALVAHIVSQIESHVQFLASQNYISQADASAIMTRLPNDNSPSQLTSRIASMGIRSVPLPARAERAPAAPSMPQGPQTPQIVQAKALWPYNENGAEPDDLSFSAGDIIEIVEETNADWWMGRFNGKQALFPSNYVQKLAAPPMPSPSTSAAKEKPAYKPFGASYHGVSAPPPPGQGTNSVGLQQVDQTEKKSKFGGLGNTMAHSAAGGVGFGAGAAIGGGLVRAIF